MFFWQVADMAAKPAESRRRHPRSGVRPGRFRPGSPSPPPQPADSRPGDPPPGSSYVPATACDAAPVRGQMQKRPRRPGLRGWHDQGVSGPLTPVYGTNLGFAGKPASTACRLHEPAYTPRTRGGYLNRWPPPTVPKPAIASGRDPIPFRTWKSNLMSLLCYLDARALGKQ